MEAKGRNGTGRIVAAGPVFLIAGAAHESSANGLGARRPRRLTWAMGLPGGRGSPIGLVDGQMAA